MRAVSLILGIVLTIWTVIAIVHAMLIPTGPAPIIARVVNGAIKGVAFAPLALMKTYSRQNRWLASIAPISLLLQLVVYVTILIFTTGLIVYGTTDLSMINSLYQSGSTLTTLGIVEPVTVASTITTFVAAFLGLVVIAIFIGYLLALYGALVARESQMARLSILAGEPAWGPEIIARAYVMGLPANEAPIYGDWINWTCDLRLNQRVNPVLGDFRSTAKYRHWVISTLATMDATAMRVALSPEEADPHAVQLLTEGGVTLSALNSKAEQMHNWDLQVQLRHAVESNIDVEPAAGLTTHDWEIGVQALQAVNYPLPADLSSARKRFFAIRSTYFANAYELASKYHAVPAPWSGDRKPHLPVIWPEIARAEAVK